MQPETCCPVAVVLERHKAPNAWEDWRFRVAEVLVDEGQLGTGSRTLRDDGRTAQVLHTGLTVQLHRDEAEGYYLNLSSGAPVWFVMWRVDEDDQRAPGPSWSPCPTTRRAG